MGLDDGLKSVAWKRFVRGPDTQLLDGLYQPALERAVRYDRCCAYFSSSVLAAAARGFGGLIENLIELGDAAPKPAVRLIVNERLDKADLRALLATRDTSRLAEVLLKRLSRPADTLQRNRLQMLAWLVKSGLLEVRVGLMRHTEGVLHAKFGIVTDGRGDSIAFMGSGNETGEALRSNYEELEVRPSWVDPEFVQEYRGRFETLWKDEDGSVHTIPLPEAVRLRLIELAPESPPKEIRHDKYALAAGMLWRYLAAAPYLPNGELACDAGLFVKLWPHQKRVVDDIVRAFPAGRLLCDEVGMGKTIEAIAALRRLLCGRGVERALLLVPAGLLRQWQDELREKGGLLVPIWEKGSIRWPDGRRKPKDPAAAMQRVNVLLLSREWARTNDNRPTLLSAPRWDLVLMDESHAARRKGPTEGFNSGNLLLQLLRDLQLGGHARSILLLSATPMQINPWEPWDLLAVTGVGGEWEVEFEAISDYYDGLARLRAGGRVDDQRIAQVIGRLVASDPEFPAPPPGLRRPDGAESVAKLLRSATSSQRLECADWLAKGTPLKRRMHRNTRETLVSYHRQGLLAFAPPRRQVEDVVYDLEPAERECYDAVQQYINKRYEQLEKERKGKGFLMTVYHRRASSSPYALKCSLHRREEVLAKLARGESVAELPEEELRQVDVRDLSDAGIEDDVDPALPSRPAEAENERQLVSSLLRRVEGLGATDSKLGRFREVLDDVTKDGRAVLVFSEHSDTVHYLRDKLRDTYDKAVACYTGDGGETWTGSEWQQVPKAEITRKLASGEIRVLVCTDAASEGLNLQAAGALINYDLPWNPAKVEQRIGRIDRIGQKYQLLPIRNLFLRDSVDMKVYQVLRERCHLFEHFVGRMQPVLSVAREFLRSPRRPEEISELLRELEEKAKKIEGDEVGADVYASADAVPLTEPDPPATLKDVETALQWLQRATMDVGAKWDKGKKHWVLRGLGKSGIAVTTDLDVLERDPEVHPITIGCGEVQQVAERLHWVEGRVPLVLAERREEQYRCVEARWVGPSNTASRAGRKEVAVNVESASQLIRLIEEWDGTPPSPEALRAAQESAGEAAQKRLRKQMEEDRAQEEADHCAQVDAARRRLLRELARALRCISDGKDLGELFRAQYQKEKSPEGRYHRVVRRLGGEPRFTSEDDREAREYVKGLGQRQRQSRVNLGSEIEAALDDPRWKADRARKRGD